MKIRRFGPRVAMLAVLATVVVPATSVRAADQSITAVATGSLTPPLAPPTQSVQNGDFLITANPAAPVTGDGIDEANHWWFDLTADPDYPTFPTSAPLLSATFTATVKPGNAGIQTDLVGIADPNFTTFIPPGPIADPTIQSLPVGVVSTVQVEFLSHYSSTGILGALQANGGRLPMIWHDDVILESARLHLVSAEGLDHFKCYSGKFPKFEPREAGLEDQFGPRKAVVFRPHLFCNPVSKNEEPTHDKDAHLKIYALRPSPGQPPFQPQTVIVRDQFGEQTIRVLAPTRLAVPAQKEGHEPPRNLDHYQCYTIENAPEFEPRVVSLEDQFVGERLRVVAPRALCAPASKNGEPVHDPETHLMAYVLERIEGEPKMEPQTFRVRTQFGEEEITVVHPRLLLVPAEKRHLKVRDQVNDPETGTSFGCGDSGLSLYESVTPAATPLFAVDLRLRVGGSFPAGGVATSINIRDGSPGGAVLGSGSAFVPGPQPVGQQLVVQIHLREPVDVAVGGTYVIEWLSPAPPGIPAGTILTWMGRDDDPYAGGNAFGCTGVPAPTIDFNFVSYTS